MDKTTQNGMFRPELQSLSSVPIEITVSVGRARPTVRDLTQFGVGSVLALDKQVDDPVDLYVGDRLIGQGVLEVSEEDGRAQLSVRLVDIAELKDAP